MSKKFLKIDADDIERASFLANNSMYFCANSDLLSEMFNKHEVPEEYQLVFFYKNLLNDSIKEFFTDIPFNFQKTKIGNIKDRLKRRDNNEKLDFHFYLINSKEVNCSKEDIINFYLMLYDNGYLKRYLNALNEFFLLNLDLDYIFELSESNKSVSEQKKLYRKKIKEKSQN